MELTPLPRICFFKAGFAGSFEVGRDRAERLCEIARWHGPSVVVATNELVPQSGDEAVPELLHDNIRETLQARMAADEPVVDEVMGCSRRRGCRRWFWAPLDQFVMRSRMWQAQYCMLCVWFRRKSYIDQCRLSAAHERKTDGQFVQATPDTFICVEVYCDLAKAEKTNKDCDVDSIWYI